MNQSSFEIMIQVFLISVIWGFYYTILFKCFQIRAWYNYSSIQPGRMITTERSNPLRLYSSYFLILPIAMKNFTKRIFFFLFILGFFQIAARAQSILNPADSVYDYDSAHKPVQPFYGQIGKWVRIPRTYFGWNTNSYKCYIYKGIPFRIKFPKTYVPGLNDGKRYPDCGILAWAG